MIILLSIQAWSLLRPYDEFFQILNQEVYANTAPGHRHICPGKNTFLNSSGICVCNAQNPFGDPEDPKGCWNCNPICDINARCIDKDKCRCNEGFIGDGIESCEKPIPIVKDFFPKSGSMLGGEVVSFSIESPPAYVVVKAYCRFGPVISEAAYANASVVQCLTQYSKPGVLAVAVAFDTTKWSRQQNSFLFIETSVSLFDYVIVFALILMSSLLCISVIWFIRREREYSEGQPYEVMPLTQWHMHVPEQLSPQAEKNCFEFLWDIGCD